MIFCRSLRLKLHFTTNTKPKWFHRASDVNRTNNDAKSSKESVVVQEIEPAPQKSASPKLEELLEPDKSTRTFVDPKETTIILFPGQGTQHVGMAKNLLKFPAARSIFKLANEVLKYDLLKLCLEGPQDILNRTEHAQPAVMVTSLAALEQLREERPRAIDTCVAAAGFSLGEITALTFAGALEFDKALKLVQVRATAMQMACDQIASGMAMVLYSPDTKITDACSRAQQWCLDRGIENPYCGIANHMFPHCKVIAGNNEALEFLEKNSKTFKIKRIKRLAVSGAFHTPLMETAVAAFSKALKNVYVQEPLIRVYSNVDGKAYKNAAHILRQLPKQIVRPVKWEQSMHEIYERKHPRDFPRTFECGPGRGLVQILQKINAKAADSALNVEA